MNPATRPAQALFLMVCLSAAGCKSAQHNGTLQTAVDDYNAQRYTQAHELAIEIEGQAKAGQREDAAYLAGLSAYQLRQTDEAERQLLIAAGSTNAQTSAKAKAMLGQVRLDQRRPREAAALLTETAQALDGEDARKAAYNAGVAYQQVGDSASSKKWLAMAGGATDQPVPMSSSSQVSAIGPTTGASFALQVGAFREKNRAKRAADDAAKLAQRDGLGQVRIVPQRDVRGKPLYLVQFGSFPTRGAAAAARAKLGKLEYIVAPAAARSS
jgi:cell division septation protein DedD